MLKVRIRKIPVTILLFVIALGGYTLYGESNVVTSVKRSISTRTAMRQKYEAEADNLFAEGNKLYISSKFSSAIEKYLDSIKAYRKCASYETDFVKERVNKCKQQIYQCYYHWAAQTAENADRLSKTHQYKTAIDLCEKAIKLYPPCKKQMEERIKQYKKRQALLEYRNKVSPDKVDPDKENRDYKVAVMMRQGDELAKAGRLKEARNIYEQIVLIAPYNIDVVERIRSVNIKMSNFARKRMYSVFKNRMDEAVWKGVIARMPDQLDGDKDVIQSPVKKVTAQDAIRQKLNNIIIPKLLLTR